MAGAGKKTFTAGEILTASDTNTYLMEQTVMYFAGTASRASAIPTPSEGMTTYIGATGTATIPQIESYTGSSFQTLYGLTQVANVSVSGVGTINIDNVFSSAYTNYLVVWDGISSAATNTLIKFRTAAGVTTTDTTYGGILLYVTSVNSTVNRALLNANSTCYVGGSGSVGSVNNMIISKPFVAAPTSVFSNYSSRDSTIEIEGGYFATVHNQATSYAGLVFFVGTGTMTGNIKIYGLRNS
jgi:hypothetical protein